MAIGQRHEFFSATILARSETSLVPVTDFSFEEPGRSRILSSCRTRLVTGNGISWDIKTRACAWQPVFQWHALRGVQGIRGAWVEAKQPLPPLLKPLLTALQVQRQVVFGPPCLPLCSECSKMLCGMVGAVPEAGSQHPGMAIISPAGVEPWLGMQLQCCSFGSFESNAPVFSFQQLLQYFIGPFFHSERKCISETKWFNAGQQMSLNLSLSNVN